MHLVEVVVAVAAAIGGLKGAEYYQIRRLKHGNPSSGRRSGSNTSIGLSDVDRDFLRGCFKDLEIDRLKTEQALVTVIREEGSKTRTAVYEANR